LQQPHRDLRSQLGDLPEWDLTDLYAATDAPEIARDLDRLEAACARLRGRLRGQAGRTRPPGC
jgi:oligoendopeptidase F